MLSTSEFIESSLNWMGPQNAPGRRERVGTSVSVRRDLLKLIDGLLDGELRNLSVNQRKTRRGLNELFGVFGSYQHSNI